MSDAERQVLSSNLKELRTVKHILSGPKSSSVGGRGSIIFPALADEQGLSANEIYPSGDVAECRLHRGLPPLAADEAGVILRFRQKAAKFTALSLGEIAGPQFRQLAI